MAVLIFTFLSQPHLFVLEFTLNTSLETLSFPRKWESFLKLKFIDSRFHWNDHIKGDSIMFLNSPNAPGKTFQINVR